MTGQPADDEPQFHQPNVGEPNIQDAHHADDIVLPANNRAGVVPTRYSSNSVSAIFSTKQRSGAWVVPPNLDANATLGTIKLDLREATFESAETTIDVGCFMGEVKIWVPEGTQIVDETHAIAAEVKVKKLGPPSPVGPRITLTGTVVFAEVTVIGSRNITLVDRIKGNF